MKKQSDRIHLFYIFSMTFFEAVINKPHPENEANCIHLFERSLGVKNIERRICPVKSQ